MREAGAYKTTCMGPVRETGWHTLEHVSNGEDPRTSVVDKYTTHDIDVYIYLMLQYLLQGVPFAPEQRFKHYHYILQTISINNGRSERRD